MKNRARAFKGSVKIVSVGLALLLFFSLFVGGETEAAGGVTRIYGDDRYETSAETSKDVYDSEDTDTVIIARGDPAGNFADGLAASVLAGVLDAPVLLTTPKVLPSSIKSEIKRLGASKAYVLGGKEAISESVVTVLKDMDLTVTRIGGADRYDTAAKIAEEAEEKGNIERYAFIVNGLATADALVAGPAAFKNNAVILQVTNNSIPVVTKDALEDLNIDEVYIIGGTAVVSSSVESALDKLVTVNKRLSGSDRYGTSVKVAEELFPDEEDAVLVGGLDASLADSIGACVYKLPILYVEKTKIPTKVYTYLENVLTDESKIRIMGGTAAVSGDVKTEVEEIISDKKVVSKISIEGDPTVGETLEAVDLKPSGATVNYQWQIASGENGSYTDITGGNDATYKIVSGDETKWIRVKVTGKGDYQGSTVFSDPVGPVVESEQ